MIHFNLFLRAAIDAFTAVFIKNNLPFLRGKRVFRLRLLGSTSANNSPLGFFAFVCIGIFLKSFSLSFGISRVSRPFPFHITVPASLALYGFLSPIFENLSTIYTLPFLLWVVSTITILTVTICTHLLNKCACSGMETTAGYTWAWIRYLWPLAASSKSIVANGTHLASKSTVRAFHCPAQYTRPLILLPWLKFLVVSVKFLIAGYTSLQDILLILRLTTVYTRASKLQFYSPFFVLSSLSIVSHYRIKSNGPL